MPYREVTMVEIREVLRLWLAGLAKKRIARQLGLDPKTVRAYVRAAESAGVRQSEGAAALTEERLVAIAAALRPPTGRPHGDTWAQCAEHRAFLAELLDKHVRLSKARKLLARRRGVVVPYATLHRYAVEALGFGRGAPTMPVADGKPGEELEVDTGWVLWLDPQPPGRRRRVRAWIFTPSVSRYRFVYPCFEETTASAIEACEAAWEFYGGVFHVLRPDNTRAIVLVADPLHARLTPAFLEYAQSRKALLNELASLRFVEAHAHVTIVGPVGVGKTFLAHALGHVACRRGHSVLALRADRMLKTLKHARLDNTYEQELRKLLAVDLLVVDDFCLDAMDSSESRDAYEILTERHRAGSMIVTSNRGPDEWLATFADPMRAQSAIDRFTSNSYDLVIEGESYRKRLKPKLEAGQRKEK